VDTATPEIEVTYFESEGIVEMYTDAAAKALFESADDTNCPVWGYNLYADADMGEVSLSLIDRHIEFVDVAYEIL
jgi:hypothetical protein